MHFNWTVTGDGLATLAAGIIAFCAVWWQVRSSASNLQKQLDAKRKAREEETVRQQRAVATAILFEIDCFYRLYIREVNNMLKCWDPETGELFVAKSVGSRPFPVYDGNAGNFGFLESGLAFDIVGFYSAAAQYLSALRDYKAEFERWHSAKVLLRDAAGVSPQAAEGIARALLDQLKKGLPHLINFGRLACKKLCEKTGVLFEAPVVAIAAENLSAEKTAATEKGNNAQTY